MLLQVMNLYPSLSFKNLPLRHGGVYTTSQPPLTQASCLVDRNRNNNNSIKCSFRSSSFPPTNKFGKIINRDHESSSKSTTPWAFEDGYASNKSRDSTIFLDAFVKKLDAFYRLSRPNVFIIVACGVSSASMLPVQGAADLTPTFFVEVFKSVLPPLLMFIPETIINQWSDIEIDKINKPYLPLASGEISKGEALAIGVTFSLMSLGMAIMLRSPPIVIGVVVRLLLAAAYSLDLPLLRWKGNTFLATLNIILGMGFNIQFPHFIHVQKFVLRRPVVFTKTFLFTAIFMAILNIVATIAKDIPDMEGDKKGGVQTLAVILGKKRVFSIVVNMLLMAYGGAVLAGVSCTSRICKLVTMLGHSVMGLVIWRRAQAVDLSSSKSSFSFYMFFFQFYCAEFFLSHFVR